MSTKETLKKVFSFYNQIDSKVEAFFTLDGKEYEVSGFQIVFGQPTDFKGQPQQEVKGGQFIITLTQLVEDSVYAWAKEVASYKSGEIRFKSETAGTVLLLQFERASCISLSQKVNAYSGLEISLVVSPAEVTINKQYLHDNHWTKPS